jgi:anti-sigma regulatory factor (Ser/Thr protein kinase)
MGTVRDEIIPPLDYSFETASLSALRGEIGGFGAANGLTGIPLYNFVVAVNEITTNAVRYAGGHGRLEMWRQADDLWCRVTDRGSGVPKRWLNASHRPKPDRIGGSGLWLARHICRSVEIETDRKSGTRVLLRYALPGPAA